MTTTTRKRSRSNPAVDSKSLELGKAKLESSGLTLDDARELGINILSAEATQALGSSYNPLCSLQFGYYGPDGQPLEDWPGCGPFYRLRYLEVGTGFATMTDEKPRRYVQGPYTAPAAYYPLNCPDWPLICADTGRPVIITEGELKAAKACKEGFPTIGIGGVFNWRSRKIGLDWLPSLDLVDWRRRNTYICFDSDYRTNPQVCSAIKSLAEALHNRGAFVHMVSLPDLEELDKVGLDDFLTHGGPDANDAFGQLLGEAVPLGLTRPLWDLNYQYIYIRNPGLIVEQATDFKTTPAAFTGHLESKATYQERTIRADGSPSYKPVSAAKKWLEWPLRLEASQLTYAPGEAKLMLGAQALYNTWPGWGVQPAKGSVRPFLDLINHIFTGAEPEAKQWFLRWCAYPLQFPGVKMFSSAVIHGIVHGTGKSFIGYTLGRIYGKNFTEITQKDLHGSFNAWAENRQFVMGDDVTGSNKREDNDFLKRMITQQELRVNTKFMPEYVIPDVINYLFTANHPDSFFLEDNDRRFFIHEVVVGALSELFYVDYELWLSTGGAEALFHYLLNLDLGDFNPAAPAFRTQAKERMITNVQSDLASWVRQLIATPDAVLRVGSVALDKDLFSTQELLSIYDPTGHTGTTANGLGRELARAGVRQVVGGKPVRFEDGSQARLYVLRNQQKWLSDKVQAKQAAVHVDAWNKKHGFNGKKAKKY